MTKVVYQQAEFLISWKRRRKSPLGVFIVQIPYCLFLTVVPSRKALNEILTSGGGGGGMGTGFVWDPFEISVQEYDALLSHWKALDSKQVQKLTGLKIEGMTFIFDKEIMEIECHAQYLLRSSEKYQSYYTEWPN